MKNSLIKPYKWKKQNGYNRRMIRLVLHSRNLPPIDISDPEQVQERISAYFDHCEKNNLIPCIAGMANWIGIHRDTLHAWKTGEYRKETHQKIIQHAYDVIEDILVAMLYDDKISSPTGIFLLKSVFGYKDRVDISLGAARPDPLAELDSNGAILRLLEGAGGDDNDRNREDGHSKTAGKD